MSFDRDVAALHAMHALRAPRLPVPTTIDDATWADLDLDEVTASFGARRSVLGELSLLAWLRSPALSASQLPALNGRLAVAAALAAAPRAWTALAPALERLPHLPALLVEVLWGSARLPTLGRVPHGLSLAALLAPAGLLVAAKVGAVLMLAAFVANLLFHFWAQRRLSAAMGSVDFVGGLLAAARVAERHAAPGPWARLAELSRSLAPLRRAVAEVTVPALLDDFPAEHLRIYLLTRERRLSRCAELVDARRAELRELWQVLGDLDAAAAVAEFRASRATCQAQLDPGAGALELREARHPLLPAGVPNDLRLSDGLVITGSNMSGKSTFLRVVALNALLAQALGFACAAAFRGPFVRVASALRATDRLSEGRSAYLAEARRVRELLALVGQEPRLLLVVDEPFRGTNSDERVAAGVAVLRWARRAGALVLAATHDLEVSRLLAGDFRHAHFTDEPTGDGLRFDYRLRPGLAGPRNAVRLLAALGYPAGVLEDAAALLGTGR